MTAGLDVLVSDGTERDEEATESTFNLVLKLPNQLAIVAVTYCYDNDLLLPLLVREALAAFLNVDPTPEPTPTPPKKVRHLKLVE